MTTWSSLRGSLFAAVLSERGTRAAARLRGAGAAGLTAFLQLDDARSLLLAQLVDGWQRHTGVAVDMVLVPAPDPHFDPAPARRLAHDRREVPWLARSFGLRWDEGWRRPAEAQRAAAHEQLFGADAPTVADFLRVAEASWAGRTSETGAVASVAAAAVGEAAVAAAAVAAAAVGGAAAGEVALRLEEGRRRLLACGHYQAPTLAIGRDPYFGLLRMEAVAERMAEQGVQLDIPRRQPDLSWPDRDAIDSLTLFTSFRSPYSYLALERAAAIAKRRGLTLHLKPVLPMVMRGLRVPRAKRMYIARDAARQARRLGIPFGKVCDPLGPGIHYCMALFWHARQLGKELPLSLSLGRGIWSQALDVASMDDLALMVERAGVRWPRAREVLDNDEWRGMAERHRGELRDCGLWGVPSMLVGEHALWGQDRLPLLEAWL